MGKKLYLFIGADRTKNAGEADYLKAMGLALGNSANVMACRLGASSETSSSKLPVDNQQYDALPVFNPDLIAAIKASEVAVVGLGNTTLASVIEAQTILKQKGIKTSASFVTHMVGEGDMQQIIDNNVRTFAPVVAEHVTQIAAVPHTNTLPASKVEHDKFMKTENGKAVAAFVGNQEPFAIAVLNAGFAIDGAHQPYTADEAYAHGTALGKNLPPHTHLILAHGGPRNLADEKAGEMTMDAFEKGYLEAQRAAGGDPQVVSERFAPDLNYNAIKAAYVLAQSPVCRAFISNAEGYGTMDGAINLVPERVMLGMFPFAAEEKDPTGQRRQNTQKYNAKGIQWLSGGELYVVSSFPRAATVDAEQPTAQIISLLGLNARTKPATIQPKA